MSTNNVELVVVELERLGWSRISIRWRDQVILMRLIGQAIFSYCLAGTGGWLAEGLRIQGRYSRYGLQVCTSD